LTIYLYFPSVTTLLTTTSSLKQNKYSTDQQTCDNQPHATDVSAQ